MKKVWLFLICILLNCDCFCRSFFQSFLVENQNQAVVNCYSDTQNLSPFFSTKLSSDFLTAVLLLESEKLDFSNIDLLSGAWYENFYNSIVSSYGIKISSPFNSIPFDLTLCSGNLLYSKSISVLKNPIFSSYSPLHSTIYENTRFGVTLPSLSSKGSTTSYFLDITPKFNFLPELQILADPHNFYGTNLFYKFNTELFKSFQISATFLMYDFKYQNDTTWYSFQKYYPENYYSSILLQNFFRTKHIKSFANLGIVENPFETPSVFIKYDFNFSSFYFNLNSAFFYGTPNLILPKGTFCNTNYQAACNPQVFIPFKNFNTKNGISLLYSNKFSKEISSINYNNFLITTGSTFCFDLITFELFISKLISDVETEYFKVEFESCFNFNHTDFTTNFQFKTDDSQNIYKISGNLQPKDKKFPIKNLNSSIYIKSKNDKITLNYSISTKIMYKTKKFSSSFEFDFNF